MTGITIRRTVAICTLAFGLACVAAPAFAQTGQIKGKVTDAQGNIVEGAAVAIENLDNGTKPVDHQDQQEGRIHPGRPVAGPSTRSRSPRTR